MMDANLFQFLFFEYLLLLALAFGLINATVIWLVHRKPNALAQVEGDDQ